MLDILIEMIYYFVNHLIKILFFLYSLLTFIAASPTFKDLDFMELYPDGIILTSEIYQNLMNSIQRDCRVLESFKIMDYSLLIGIHNIDQVET